VFDLNDSQRACVVSGSQVALSRCRSGEHERDVESELSVAIIGLGSRGLGVLERIITLSKRQSTLAPRVRVDVLDPTCVGCGLHGTDQPDYLLLNTVCSQVSMFPDAHSVGEDVDEPGPNLYEWATSRDLRLAKDGFSVGSEGRPIQMSDFLPRRLLGEYLAWFLQTVVRGAPDHVKLRFHRASATDIRGEADKQLTITLEDGTTVTTQYAFLTLGHTPNALIQDAPSKERWIADPYPLPARLRPAAPAESIAIDGFGLAAMDIIAACTVGRGGHFARDHGALRYVPADTEPELYLYSRSGVPFRARPHLRRPRRPYIPIAMTHARIEAIRANRGGRLDFDRDVLGLLHTEMRTAYHRCHLAISEGDAAEKALIAELTRAAATGDLTALLDDLDRRSGAFDPYEAWDRSAGIVLTNSVGYESWVVTEIGRDLVEAEKGLELSCEKAAVEVVREMRDAVRQAVDFGGLTDESLERFMRFTVSLMNKAVVGPQKERHQELLALIDAGIMRIPFGPAPARRWDPDVGRWTVASTRLATPFSRHVDWVCSGHTRAPSVSSSACPLVSRLHAKGRLVRHRPPGSAVDSVDLDRDMHPVDSDGRPERRLWILGPLCEGATFYNHAVPATGGYSRVLRDADRTVKEMFATASSQDLRSRDAADRQTICSASREHAPPMGIIATDVRDMPLANARSDPPGLP